jgi:hypothetical protein
MVICAATSVEPQRSAEMKPLLALNVARPPQTNGRG